MEVCSRSPPKKLTRTVLGAANLAHTIRSPDRHAIIPLQTTLRSGFLQSPAAMCVLFSSFIGSNPRFIEPGDSSGEQSLHPSRRDRELKSTQGPSQEMTERGDDGQKSWPQSYRNTLRHF